MRIVKCDSCNWKPNSFILALVLCGISGFATNSFTEFDSSLFGLSQCHLCDSCLCAECRHIHELNCKAKVNSYPVNIMQAEKMAKTLVA